MPRPIILPPQQQFQPKQSPYMAGFQNMLMRMFMMKFGANIRGQEAETAAKRLEGRQERSDVRQAELAGKIEEHKVPVGDIGYKEVGQPKGTMRYAEKLYRRTPRTDKWIQLKPINVQGSIMYPQKNILTGEIKFTRVPPKAKGAGGGAPTLPQKHQVILKELNEIRAKNKLNPLDVFELGSLSAEERKKFLRKQTQSVISQLTGRDKTRYLQLTKKLESVTEAAVGRLPKARTEVRRGIDPESGRPVIEYSDGTIEYAD